MFFVSSIVVIALTYNTREHGALSYFIQPFDPP